MANINARNTIKNNNPITNKAPISPNSSQITAKIKSVCASGR